MAVTEPQRWSSDVFSTQPESLTAWERRFHRLPEPQKDIYSEPRYMDVVAAYYGYELEMFAFGEDDNYVVYPYFKRSLRDLAFYQQAGQPHGEVYDIISSWYYGGPYIRAENAQTQNSLVQAFIEAFHQHCLEHQIIAEFIRYDPIHDNHLPFVDYFDIQANREAVYVDLTQTDDEIWRDMRGGCQRSIKRALSENLEVAETQDPQDIRTFFEVYDEEMRRKDAPAHLYFTQAFIEDTLNASEGMVLLAARYEGKMVGGFMIASGYGVGHHFLSASLADYWHLRVNNLLFYEAIRWGKKHGLHVFDFQGGRPGVYRFKRNFSRTTNTFYTLKQIHDLALYEETSRLWAETYSPEISASARAQGFFPVYRFRDRK